LQRNEAKSIFRLIFDGGIVDKLILELGVIYGGSAVLATLFLYLKQPVVLAYIFSGILFGPSVLGWVKNPDAIEGFSHFGIILLMFLIGINLDIKELFRLLKKTALLTVGSSLLFASASFLTLLAFKLSPTEALIASAGLMFSSTVIGLKLIPTTDLHNKRIGELMISILLFQDILAIFVILLFSSHGQPIFQAVPLLILKTILISTVGFLIVKHVVFRLFMRFDVIQEYIFIFSIGWCLFFAEIAALLGLSHEIGAFIAGLTLAISPVASIIAEKLKPLREFFLILFFFAIGAGFEIKAMGDIILPALVLSIVLVVIKPLVFRWGFRKFGEKDETAHEIGVRLGQGSEFSLLVAASATSEGLISHKMLSLIEVTVILTFMFSTYRVLKNYATPISADPKQRRD